MISFDYLIQKLGNIFIFILLFIILIGGWYLTEVERPVASTEDITEVYSRESIDTVLPRLENYRFV